MLALLLFAVILVLSFGMGARILRLLLPPQQPEKANRAPQTLVSPSEEFVFATALGLGIFSYVLFGIGLARGYYSWVLWGLLVIAAVIGWPEIKRWYGELQVSGRGLLRRRFSTAGILMGLWLIIAGGFCLLGALAPTTDLGWDGLTYHLAVPKIYLQHHRILMLPWMSHSDFPFATEMLYLLGLALQGQALAKLFHFGFGALIAIAVYCWTKSAYGKTMGLVAAAIFASVPLVLWESTVPYNDLSFALYCLLAIWAWWRRNEGNAKGWILLSGICTGLALGTKPLAGMLALFIVMSILWPERRDEMPKAQQLSRIRMLFIWLIPAVLVAAPWYIRTFIWTGNPVYPFFYGIFGGRYWSQALADQYAMSQVKFGMGHEPQWLLALPWTLTMSSRWFFDRPEQRIAYNMMIAVLGPLFLGFLPLLLLQAKQDRLMRYLLAFCAVMVVSWFFLSAQTTRYLLPIFPALVIGMAGAFAYAHQTLRTLARVMNVALGMELVWAIGTCLLFITPQIPVVIGGETQEKYLSRIVNIYPISKSINSTLPRDARIMLFGDTRGYYIDREYMWGPGNHNLITPEELASPDSLMAALRQLKVTHVLLAPSVLKTFSHDKLSTEPVDRSLRELLYRGDLEMVLSEHSFAVFSLDGK